MMCHPTVPATCGWIRVFGRLSLLVLYQLTSDGPQEVARWPVPRINRVSMAIAQCWLKGRTFSAALWLPMKLMFIPGHRASGCSHPITNGSGYCRRILVGTSLRSSR